jgi:hypothetical protein
MDSTTQVGIQVDELRALVAQIIEVNADARRLAAELSRTIMAVADTQCDAIDARLVSIRAALGQAQ